MKIDYESINKIIIALIFLSLLSILFFPMDKIELIRYPIYIVVILAAVYLIIWKFKK